MRSTRARRSVGALFGVVLATALACAPDTGGPTGATEPPSSGFGDVSRAEATLHAPDTRTQVRVPAILRRSPLNWDLIVTRDIDRSGGVIDVPAAGLRLVVPAGAVSQTTRFRITAHRGAVVAYTFEPHGATFAVPLRFEQGTANLLFDPSRQTARGGYFRERSQIDLGSQTALVDEFRPTEVSATTGRITFGIEHFSGYLCSSG